MQTKCNDGGGGKEEGLQLDLGKRTGSFVKVLFVCSFSSCTILLFNPSLSHIVDTSLIERPLDASDTLWSWGAWKLYTKHMRMFPSIINNSKIYCPGTLLDTCLHCNSKPGRLLFCIPDREASVLLRLLLRPQRVGRRIGSEGKNSNAIGE